MDLEEAAVRKRVLHCRDFAMLSKGFPFSQTHKATGIFMGTLSNMKNGRSSVDRRNWRLTVIP
jgi:hypothetical protein